MFLSKEQTGKFKLSNFILIQGSKQSHFISSNSHIKMFVFLFFSDPVHGPRKLEVVEIKSWQITITWEPFGYNVTRCHKYNLTVHYRCQTGGQEQVREEVSWDTDNSHPQHTITNLSPYTNVSVKLILMNPEGRKESQEIVVQTDEDGKF